VIVAAILIEENQAESIIIGSDRLSRTLARQQEGPGSVSGAPAIGLAILFPVGFDDIYQ
jgi:hypothetical protein